MGDQLIKHAFLIDVPQVPRNDAAQYASYALKGSIHIAC